MLEEGGRGPPTATTGVPPVVARLSSSPCPPLSSAFSPPPPPPASSPRFGGGRDRGPAPPYCWIGGAGRRGRPGSRRAALVLRCCGEAAPGRARSCGLPAPAAAAAGRAGWRAGGRRRRRGGGGVSGRAGRPRMLRFLRRTFGRRSMQRYGRGAGRGGLGGEGDERDGGLRGAAAAAGGFPSSPHPGGVVHGAGAPVHIPAAGGSKPVLQCRVLLLDGTEVSVELPVSNVRFACGTALTSPLFFPPPHRPADRLTQPRPPNMRPSPGEPGYFLPIPACLHLLPGARRPSPP